MISMRKRGSNYKNLVVLKLTELHVDRRHGIEETLVSATEANICSQVSNEVACREEGDGIYEATKSDG